MFVFIQINIAKAFSTSNGTIIDSSGKEVPINGINWFGFETDTHIVHGLWVRNWQDMISQVKTLGFNAVRIPFCPASLSSSTIVSGVHSGLNPDMDGLSAPAAMDKLIDGLESAGLYYILDHHSIDCSTISELWYNSTYTESSWINDLVSIANRYKGKAHFLGIDLKNEPHGVARWGNGDASTDWKMAAEKAASSIYAVNSDILSFIEGVEIDESCGSKDWSWWGGQLRGASCKPIDNPHGKIIYSPHVYGPDTYWQSDYDASNFPDNMPAIWDTEFGFIRSTTTPLVIGEWGGKYGTDGGLAADATLLNKLVDYFISKKIYNHFWWSLNPNSTDTGGILKDDWTNIWQEKVDLINRLSAARSADALGPPASITITPSTINLVEGTSNNLSASCQDSLGHVVSCGSLTWKSVTSQLTMSSSGKATAGSPLLSKYCKALTGIKTPRRLPTYANYACKISGTVKVTESSKALTSSIAASIYSDEAVTLDLSAPETAVTGEDLNVSLRCLADSGKVEVPCGSVTYSGVSGYTGGTLNFSSPGTYTLTAYRNAYSSAQDSVTIVVTESQHNLVLAFLGDYGEAGSNEQAVVNLVNSWNPDYVITLGDNNYFADTLANYASQADYDAAAMASYDENIGQYFGDYMAEGRFFPAMGNHEVDIDTNGGHPMGYFYEDYFADVVPGTSSGNQRYYNTYVGDDVELFALSSDPREPDGRSMGSDQYLWMEEQMQNSTARFRLVIMHHPPYSSGSHGSTPDMQWDYNNLGMDMVLAGHDHDYERLESDGIPYIVDGTGGKSLYSFVNIVPESLVQYDDNYGALRAEVDSDAGTITFEYINIDGVVVDRYVLSERNHPRHVDLIDSGNTWHYQDNGTEPDATWKDPTFDDSSWKTGTGSFGYEAGQTTTVSYGPSSTSKYITTYLRTTFDVADTLESVSLNLQRDDGVVIYLNGSEIYRSNMPDGATSYSTKATTAIGGSDETAWHSATLDPALLISGSNTLAVELHQSSGGSSDLFLNLNLEGLVAP